MPIIDHAITRLLSIDAKSCRLQSFGGAGSASSFKLTINENGKTKHYFMKTGPSGDMFRGEHESLHALNSVVPTICPASLAYGKLSDSADHYLLTDFLDENDRDGSAGSGRSLAQKLAKLHTIPASPPVGYDHPVYGFPVTTFCGSNPQNNAYKASWAEFFADNRLRSIFEIAEDKQGVDEDLRAWVEKTASEVVPGLLGDGHLGGTKGIEAVLVHGDLWCGNKGRGRLGDSTNIEEVVFDPSCCYAHSEYEIGIMTMFGGFSSGFFKEYHSLVPKTEPVDEYEDRVQLYQLYHCLNHYALFGAGYRSRAMGIMEKLNRKYGTIH